MPSLIRPGLVSVTFRALSPAQVLELATKNGLQAIEWGGDVHVPPGDLARAADVGNLTRGAGLAVACYGSYYRLGQPDDKDDFAAVLETALALRAPLIRIWAGTQSPSEVDEELRRKLIADAQRCAEGAAQAGVRVALEFHRGTLTESAGSTLRFLTQVGHNNLRTLWQPIYWPQGLSGNVVQSNKEDLERLLPFIENAHVFSWSEAARSAAEPKPATRRWPLGDGADAWHAYLNLLSEPTSDDSSHRERYALLEFVRDDDPRHLPEDAAALRGWLSELEGPTPPTT